MFLSVLAFIAGLALAAATPKFLKWYKYNRAASHLPGPPLKGILEKVLGFPLHLTKDKSKFQWEYTRVLDERGPLVAARIFHKRVRRGSAWQGAAHSAHHAAILTPVVLSLLLFCLQIYMVADPEVTTAVLARPQLFDKKIASYKMGTKVGALQNPWPRRGAAHPRALASPPLGAS
jgi:hypothetical protein